MNIVATENYRNTLRKIKDTWDSAVTDLKAENPTDKESQEFIHLLETTSKMLKDLYVLTTVKLDEIVLATTDDKLESEE